ncbi:phosphoribosylanthranilate isomerase [Hyphobacterium sp.]|uniref:phosphoribosylanthranilate isomerase n=1 Tax=Hyphobacterium sp. TaxID=2004662 RepID=UPI003BAA3750
MTDIKFCGLRTPQDVSEAVRLGARWVGLVHFPPSPRHIKPSKVDHLIALKGEAESVAVLVDPDDALIDAANAAGHDWLQLHGQETPDRVAEVKARTGLRVIKALPVAEAADMDAAKAFDGIADMILFDAKPPQGADRPGGWGEGYDYGLLKSLRISTPWLLSGGLHAHNVRAAVKASGAMAVDVSSGIERAPGVKSATKMAAFAAALRD